MTDIKLIALFVVFMLVAFGSGIVVGQFIHATPATTVVDDNNDLPVVFNQTFNGTTVNVSLGSEFIVCLPENGASTGYRWDPISSNGLDLLEDQYLPPSIDLIGAPGLREFHFKASQAGTQGVQATLRRSWQNLTGDEEVFTLTVNVS